MAYRPWHTMCTPHNWNTLISPAAMKSWCKVARGREWRSTVGTRCGALCHQTSGFAFFESYKKLFTMLPSQQGETD